MEPEASQSLETEKVVMTTYCLNTPFAQSIYHVPFQWNIGKQDEHKTTPQTKDACQKEGLVAEGTRQVCQAIWVQTESR
jgi:hypothetical protein